MTRTPVRSPRLSRAGQGLGVIVTAAVVIALPALLSGQWLALVVQGLLLSLVVLGLTVLAGYGGQFSIASVGLLAVGAAVLGVVTTQLGAPPLVGIVGATLGGALVGLLVGLPALRLRGLYLMLSTLAAHFIAVYAYGRYVSEQYGAYGLVFDPLSVAGVRFDSDTKWFYLLAVLVGLVAWFVRNLRGTGQGRSLLAMKHNEIAAAASGIDVARLKLTTFVTTSALTAFAGSLYGFYYQSLSGDFFTLQTAINLYVALVVGGQFSGAGAVLGSMFVVAGPTLVTKLAGGLNMSWLDKHSSEATSWLFGLSIVLVLVLQPAGLWGWIERGWRWLRCRLRRPVTSAARPIVAAAETEAPR